jgi:hypothetical protein
MEFAFPSIAGDCPVCGTACGAVYRGYYRRWGVAPEAPFEGWIAIRTALCRRLGRRYAVFPSFLVPLRPFSREGFRRLVDAWRLGPRRLVDAVDAWWRGFEREVYLSISTLYSQLRFVVRELRVSHVLEIAAVPAVQRLRSVADLAEVPAAVVTAGIAHPSFGCGASLRIDPPPDLGSASKPRDVKPPIG